MAIMVKGTRAASDAPFKWPTRSLKALASLSFFTRLIKSTKSSLYFCFATLVFKFLGRHTEPSLRVSYYLFGKN